MKIIKLHKVTFLFFNLLSVRALTRIAGLLHRNNCLACEFTAHYACKNAEMNLKSTTNNGFNFRIINS